MSMVLWPQIRMERGVIAKKLSLPEPFWVISPSLLHKYPQVAERKHFLVQKADLDTLLQLKGILAQEQPSNVYAFGGGKTIDIAKLAVRLGKLDENAITELSKRKWIPQEKGYPLSNTKLTSIPSTAGSGSEVSEIAVLTIAGHKVPFAHASLLPDEVLLDTEPLQHAPIRVLWNGLWDSFVHALESAVSPLATPWTRRLSLDSLRSSVKLIDFLTKNEEIDELLANEALYNNILAGKAQSVASVGIAHALAHQVESSQLWHGEACAQVLPHVIALNMDKAMVKYDTMLQEMGFADKDDFVDWITVRVRETVGEWEPFAANEGELSLLIANMMKDPCFRTNCAYISRRELTDWLGRWFYVAS
ncbi:iron-containing alcohol dehydrogenase [Paenibacillus sp. MSJ-34]|uniref:iron-containing alcohol dehydrogenase n=1 Tax=Paenibacillus sp. MSJ-34 TaxID=2841529 RepID=UPI001C0F9C20|nr:iron-containing alcohol dehydrogenase [Paenibacillus sp. MSJ-34]MBU5441005.1 iron-containing alcohol dehydrogenase [Paenibacillus sp. MSJ-34]